jgi:hypothetical protein
MYQLYHLLGLIDAKYIDFCRVGDFRLLDGARRLPTRHIQNTKHPSDKYQCDTAFESLGNTPEGNRTLAAFERHNFTHYTLPRK